METATLLLERYKIIESLGEGGFSKVVKAFDTKMERVVAIKTIPAGRQRAVRALREAKTVALLNHPNIVTLFEFEQKDDSYYLIMEFIEGQNLAALLDRYQKLPNDLALAATIQICEALSFAHKNDVIHRDIKPANLRVLDDGRIKVMDFGIARLRSAAKTSGLTAEGEVVGTFAYMSPEQARGEMVDERSDIFSLGILLYEMVTGRLPFFADTPAGTIYKILNDAPVPAEELERSVPSALGQVINQAISKDPQDRFQNTSEMKTRLEGLLQIDGHMPDIVADLVEHLEEPIETSDDGLLFSLRRTSNSWVRKHQDTAIATTFAVGSSLVASWANVYMTSPLIPLQAFLPVAIFFLALFLPPAGLAALFALISAGVWQISPFLGAVSAVIFILLFLTLGRSFPHIAIVPFLVPALAWLGIPFVFPLIAGLAVGPVVAAFLAAAGALVLALAEILGQTSYVWSINSTPEIVPAVVKFKGQVADLSSLTTFFTSHPFILAQVAIWAIAGWITAFIRGLSSAMSHWFALIIGFASLVLGYRLVPEYLNIEYDFEHLFLQPLTFSLIVLLVITIFFFHFAKRPRA